MASAALRTAPQAGPSSPQPAADFTVRTFATLEAAEPVWRALEAGAVLTPCQRFEWIAAWHRAGGIEGEIAIVVIEADGRPVALLPLEIGRRLGLRRAALIGADMGNADWMVVAPDVAARLTPDMLTGLLARAAAEVGGIDLISLFDQPAEWNGIANPLLGFA